jgi:hypothetical protein
MIKLEYAKTSDIISENLDLLIDWEDDSPQINEVVPSHVTDALLEVYVRNYGDGVEMMGSSIAACNHFEADLMAVFAGRIPADDFIKTYRSNYLRAKQEVLNSHTDEIFETYAAKDAFQEC